MRVKKYIDFVDAEMMTSGLEDLNRRMNGYRKEYGVLYVFSEYNDGCAGFDIYAEINETESMKIERLREKLMKKVESYNSYGLELVFEAIDGMDVDNG